MPAKTKPVTKNADAAALGSIGGSSGTGDAKRRSTQHYSDAGKKGVKAMLAATAGRRSEIARKAAKARWAKKTSPTK